MKIFISLLIIIILCVTESIAIFQDGFIFRDQENKFVEDEEVENYERSDESTLLENIFINNPSEGENDNFESFVADSKKINKTDTNLLPSQIDLEWKHRMRIGDIYKKSSTSTKKISQNQIDFMRSKFISGNQKWEGSFNLSKYAERFSKKMLENQTENTVYTQTKDKIQLDRWSLIYDDKNYFRNKNSSTNKRTQFDSEGLDLLDHKEIIVGDFNISEYETPVQREPKMFLPDTSFSLPKKLEILSNRKSTLPLRGVGLFLEEKWSSISLYASNRPASASVSFIDITNQNSNFETSTNDALNESQSNENQSNDSLVLSVPIASGTVSSVYQVQTVGAIFQMKLTDKVRDVTFINNSRVSHNIFNRSDLINSWVWGKKINFQLDYQTINLIFARTDQSTISGDRNFYLADYRYQIPDAFDWKSRLKRQDTGFIFPTGKLFSTKSLWSWGNLWTYQNEKKIKAQIGFEFSEKNVETIRIQKKNFLFSVLFPISQDVSFSLNHEIATPQKYNIKNKEDLVDGHIAVELIKAWEWRQYVTVYQKCSEKFSQIFSWSTARLFWENRSSPIDSMGWDYKLRWKVFKLAWFQAQLEYQDRNINVRRQDLLTRKCGIGIKRYLKRYDLDLEGVFWGQLQDRRGKQYLEDSNGSTFEIENSGNEYRLQTQLQIRWSPDW